MKTIQFFSLALCMTLGVSSLFAADPVKPGPGKPDATKEPEQSYVWIKYSCASQAANPQAVEMVTGYIGSTSTSPRPCYRPQNWQSGSTLNTGMISCQAINPFQECTAPFGGYICAVRYLQSEIEPYPAGQGTNLRPKAGVTFEGHEYRSCGSILPDPPCSSPVYSPCSNSWPWTTP